MKAWWTNDIGEPLYSPEQIRAEESYQPDPYDDDDCNWFDVLGEAGTLSDE